MGYPPQGAVGVSEFIELEDTPAAYAAQAGKFPKVNVGEDALEFAAGGLSVWTKVYDGGVPTATVWGYGTDLPLPKRTNVSASVEGGKIYAVGGGDSQLNSTEDVDCYDPASETWTSKADRAVGSQACSSGVVTGVIYFHGQQNTTLKQCYSYDPATDTWTGKNSSTNNTSMSPAGISGTLIYFPCHSNNDTTPAEYDTVGNSWADKTSTPREHSRGWGGETGGVIYWAGGTPNRNKTDAYDMAGDSWTAKADVPADHQVDSGGSAMISAILYGFGGKAAASTPFKKTSAFDTAGNSWTGKEDMPVDKLGIHTGCGMVGGKAYAIAGEEESTFPYDVQKSVLVFTPAQVYLLWSGTLNMGDAIAVYRPGGTTKIYADGKIYIIAGSGCVFPIFTNNCPVRVEIPYTDDYTEIEVWKGE